MLLFDERWIGSHGIGRFAAELARRIPHQEVKVGGQPMSAFDPLRLAMALRRSSACSTFLSPGYNAPLWGRQKFILTVHDLNHLDRPENASVAKTMYYETVLKRACRRAFAVMTVSEFSRRRILDWTGLPEQNVVNVGNGVDVAFAASAKAFTPGYDYVLCVGNRKLHKNEERVVRAFAASGLAARSRLVFTGEATRRLSEVTDECGLMNKTVFLGRVEDAALPGLYRGALCLAFPSLYEGFGLPAIEAMACGTPVVTSTTTSLPEVAGDAALLVDPESVADIAAALVRAASDADLREVLRGRGLRQAARFTWDAVVERVLDVLRSSRLRVTGESA